MGTLEALTTQLSEFILTSNKKSDELQHGVNQTNKTLQQFTVKLSNLEAKVTKFDEKFNKLQNELKTELPFINKRLTEVEAKAKEAEKSANFTSGLYDEVKLKVDATSVGNDSLRKQVDNSPMICEQRGLDVMLTPNINVAAST